ncbi:Microsomal glutathione S-transferase 3 [Smittium culicis]|uniref:Microsomal glutathione S-transferase 3 n=1 Tax=Smittium culicis TaxID=133412 RepID=A0A1R1Y302_9FUNG|nr:Microsomal glutathione S-transferase 3 [Smittium culicis]OMJ21435.1 Microsomal glutathione S-transferase 3 [Smittium culicis]
MITVGNEYAWNLLAATVMGLQCFAAGMSVVGARKKYKVDYPDMGSGRYSAKLSDKEWVEFNSIMRVHQNYIEQLPLAILSVLVNGLFNPIQSAIAGDVYIVGRFIYSHGYKAYGPKGRMAGAMISMLAIVFNVGSSFFGIYNTLRGN